MRPQTRLERFRTRTLSTEAARMIASFLDEVGIPAAPILRAAGVRPSDLEASGGRISGAQQIEIEHGFARASAGRPDLWLDLGLRYHPFVYGPFAFAALNARDVSRSIELLVGLQELDLSVIDYELRRDARGALTHWVSQTIDLPADLRDYVIVRDVAAIRRFLDDAVQREFPFSAIELPIDPPDDPAVFRNRLRAPVTFGAPAVSLEFGPGWESLPMPFANPLVERTYERHCRELLEALRKPPTEAERIVGILVRCRGRWPTLAEAARMIGGSSRTLRRRLASAGTSYRQLLDEARRQQADDLLTGSALTVEQIAEQLGYAETASFTHAYRRWTGMPPRAARAATPPSGGTVEFSRL